MSTASSWSPPSPGPERRACGGASIATGAMRIQRTKTMASKQTNKQATSTAKTNDPARKPERQPRRRISEERSNSVATQASSAAVPLVVAPEGASESIERSENTALSLEDQTSQPGPISQ